MLITFDLPGKAKLESLIMKKALSLLLSLLLLLCDLGREAVFAQEAGKTEIKVGFVPGPYIDGFKAGVEPELRKKGYKVR